MRRATLRAIFTTCVAVAVGAAPACAGGSAHAIPVGTLSSSPQSLVAFEAIRDSWGSLDTTPAVIRARIDGFLDRFPNDGLAPIAHILRALVAMAQADDATADKELDGPEPPVGTVHDLWTVARAQRARVRGDPSRALDMLMPLVGKMVDPLGRAVFQEELSRTSLATHLDFVAISYMDAWLRGSRSEDRHATVAKVRSLVSGIAAPVLKSALDAIRSRRASSGYGTDIERILTDRLVEIATTSGDSALARSLLDSDAGSLAVSRDAAAALGDLAMRRRGVALVDGRTIGLLLPAESIALRDESADVLLGLMWALGLPAGVRGAPQASAPPTQDSGGQAPCAPLGTAPTDRPPLASDSIRLVTRDDSGGTEATETSLAELAGEGASIIVAGVDESTSIRALRWANEAGVAVIAIVAPQSSQDRGSFGFVLGESRAKVEAALAAASPLFARSTVVPVVDESELPSFPAEGVTRSGLHFAGPVSCDTPAPRAGQPRFPVDTWTTEGVQCWMGSGSQDCADELVNELTRNRAQGTVALTLEASAWPTHDPGLRVVTASAGLMPASKSAGGELGQFLQRFGRISWWSALARDAGALARTALIDLPNDTVSDLKGATERRAAVRDRLAAARARLWTSEAVTWGPDHAMARTLCVIGTPTR